MNLTKKINQKLKDKPLIYFAREAERALGLETLLENYHICCIEDSYIVEQLLEKGHSVFCLEREVGTIEQKSSSQLIKHPKTQQWIASVAGDSEFYAKTFLPTRPFAFHLEKLGGTLLGNSYELYERFENKVSQAEIFKEIGVSSPNNIIGRIDELHFEQATQKVGSEFVVQTARAHTGTGTHFVNSVSDFSDLQENLAGNTVRISEKIRGIAVTINACIIRDLVAHAKPQVQITGVPELTAGSGSTVGNDFGAAEELSKTGNWNQRLIDEIQKIGQYIGEQGFKGIFGIDAIVSENFEEVSVIEINARQTANIPFQTALELAAGITPLHLFDIATWLGIEIEEKYDNHTSLEGSQLFLRAKEDGVIKTIAKASGVYKDDSVVGDACTIESISDNELLLITKREGERVNISDEVARIQLKQSVLDANHAVKSSYISFLKDKV